MQACRGTLKGDGLRHLRALWEDGRLQEALWVANSLRVQGLCLPIPALFHLLQCCISKRDVKRGKELHSLIINSGLQNNAFLASHVICMFSVCRSLPDAVAVFNDIPTHIQTVFTWNAIISAHVQHRQYVDAIKLYDLLCKSPLSPDKHIFAAVLKACTCKSTLNHGRRIHSHCVKGGSELDLQVANTVVAMYAKSGSVDDAHHVFTWLPEKDSVTWNAMITGYGHHGEGLTAINLFLEMYHDGHEPTVVTFLCVIKACTSIAALNEGMLIHFAMMKLCLEQEAFVETSLIDMYSKCGSVEDALHIFNRSQKQDLAMWNALIGAFAQHGLCNLAMDFFQEMQNKGVKPDRVSFLSILRVCTSLTDLQQGKLIENQLSQALLGYDTYVASTLIDMYVKCGSMEDAYRIFSNLRKRDLVVWNTMVGGCVQHGQFHMALELLQQMEKEGVDPDPITCVCLLKASFSSGSLVLGKIIHMCIIGSGLEGEVFVQNSILDMYAKFGSMKDAHVLFDRMPKRDVVPWNTMMSGFLQHEQEEEAFRVFGRMQWEGMHPDKVTLVLVLKCCSCMEVLDHVKLVHTQVVESGLESDTLIESNLIDAYGKFGAMKDAKRVFDKTSNPDVHSWNALISGYVLDQQVESALQVFEDMQKKAIQPDETTFIAILQACPSLQSLESSKILHDHVIRHGLEADVCVMSTLIDVYAKCGGIKEASSIFQDVPKLSVVTWTAMISGHVQGNNGMEALRLFNRMQLEGLDPNQATFVYALKACIVLTSLNEGKLVHGCVIEDGLASDEAVGSALIDMYTTCGSIEDAYKVFSKLPTRDVVTWSALIGGFSQRNDKEMALQHFEEMQKDGLQPDDVTLVLLLSACSHVGLLKEGFGIFCSITEDQLSIDHFNCLIDLLARAGQLNKAEDVLDALPLACRKLGWRVLLGHCQMHDDVRLGRRCFDHLVTLGMADAAVYKLMTNIYSCAGMLDAMQALEEMRRSQVTCKTPGKLLLEGMHDLVLDNHSFLNHDSSSENEACLPTKVEMG